MIKIIWDNKYSVGNERIDHEHQVFLDLIKCASLAGDEHLSKERVLRMLIEVKKYAEFHFVSEENIMLDAEYPDYEVHKKEHDILLSRFDGFFHNYMLDACEMDEVVEFMFEWFALHTTTVDQELGRYLRER